jgi:mono/diheme cytochrome c family protein
MRRFVFLLAVAAPLLLAAAPRAAEDAARYGKALAAANCGRCHAVGRAGASPNPKSPPFRFLARKYPLSNLEEALGEGIVVGHEGPDMPQFQFNAKQIAALLAYLGSIQR